MDNFTNSSGSVEIFNPIFCNFIDMPESRRDCSTKEPGKCIYCPIIGLYLTGESINDFGAAGHSMCQVMLALIIAICLFGVFSNIIIISIFNRRKTQKAFNFLMVMLAVFNLFCCITTIVTSTADNAYFARSGSTFSTMLITIERYLIIAYPVKSANLFTSRRAKILSCFIPILAAVLTFPRFTMYVDTNDLTDIPSISKLTHIIRATELNKFFYVTLNTIHSKIDFWLPLPVLLFFNILSFRHVRRIAKKRNEMQLSRNQKKDIRAVKMFLPVVIVLFLCNVEFVITYIIILQYKIVYRELFTLLLLFVAINSSANLPIYYFREAQFKAETRVLLNSWFPFLKLKGNDENIGTNTSNAFTMDLPESREDCSTEVPGKCIKCPILGSYFTGESIDDFGSPGHVICFTLWALTTILGTFGLFNNTLIISIFRKRNGERAFNFLLIMLAGFDFCCCALSIIASTACLAYFENWTGRGQSSMYWYYISCFMLMFFRSGSTFMTVLITIERYLVIAFPMKSTTLFTSRKTKVMALFVPILAMILSIPRFSSMYVDQNDIADIPSTRELTHIIRSTKLDKFWYVTLLAVHDQIDYWLPLPILLLFNILSFRHVQRISNKRKEMNMSKRQKKDIRAVKMFLPVVIVLFLCNIEVVINYVVVLFLNIVSRELYMGLLFSVAVNSSANLPIYYFREGRFKTETRAVLSSWFPFLKWGESMERNQTSTAVGSSNNEDF
ncbi:unnamed protein product [Orchesella dallaii]|uniref:G-protein coupled receptors family 1 profile domain-containing protein n=1 Tax=Orchesella dallaii TaxID=48710 RepID=A0ABP1QLU0_9HEXA